MYENYQIILLRGSKIFWLNSNQFEHTFMATYRCAYHCSMYTYIDNHSKEATFIHCNTQQAYIHSHSHMYKHNQTWPCWQKHWPFLSSWFWQSHGVFDDHWLTDECRINLRHLRSTSFLMGERRMNILEKEYEALNNREQFVMQIF